MTKGTEERLTVEEWSAFLTRIEECTTHPRVDFFKERLKKKNFAGALIDDYIDVTQERLEYWATPQEGETIRQTIARRARVGWLATALSALVGTYVLVARSVRVYPETERV
jgi:hypothetical protein